MIAHGFVRGEYAHRLKIAQNFLNPHHIEYRVARHHQGRWIALQYFLRKARSGQEGQRLIRPVQCVEDGVSHELIGRQVHSLGHDAYERIVSSLTRVDDRR